MGGASRGGSRGPLFVDSRSIIRAACAVLIYCVSLGAAAAAILGGTIRFPGSDDPAMTVYVYSLDAARLRALSVPHGRRGFRFAVPSGRYVVFAAPNGAGAPDVYGGYTHCSGNPPPSTPTRCDDHSLRTVVIDRRTRRVDVAIDDWSLSDADANALDRIRGLSATAGPPPEGAPRFSEYPAAAAMTATTKLAAPAARRLGRLALSLRDRMKLRDVLAAGPNFAGDVTLDVAHCGAHCLRILLLDWRGGGVVDVPDLAAVDDDLPCRTSEAVLFRRDSRLLSVTRMRGRVIATQYYLWDPTAASLRLLAVYPRKPSQYCAVDPP